MKNKHGQTALILIVLSAVALMFLAATLNWGHIAQTKVLTSTAADEGAALLASEVASYGEQEKMLYLQDTNKVSASTGVIVAIFSVIVAIIAVVLAIPTGGASLALAFISLAMSVVNLVLQVTVVQPMITSMWNDLQKNQPIQQQFFEQGIAAALQGSVTDHGTITDYFDWNANGSYGLNQNNFPNDTASRFAVYYTERLKMMNQTSPSPSPQVLLFYDALSGLMNGGSCDLNANEVALGGQLGVTIPGNPACSSLDCVADPIDPACQVNAPNTFQLSDACVASGATSPQTYTPFCDPCCQPKPPASCPSGSVNNCSINNPYSTYGSYPYLYDPTFQNYALGRSLLDQLGRDQQFMPQGSSIPPTSMTPDVLLPAAGTTPPQVFPNGIFPFFWLMKDYSPEVDNINPAATPVTPSQYHWCVAGTPTAGSPATVPVVATPVGFSDLAQLSLPYTCSGADCCVNDLGSSGYVIDMVGSPNFLTNPYPGNPALDPAFAEPGGGTWREGDNETCLTTWPYNGANVTIPDGTCQWSNSNANPATLSSIPANATVNGLNDTVHTLSDFVNFANTALNRNAGTLSASFDSWYPQAATWIGGCQDGSACNKGQCSDGTSCVGSLPPIVTNFNNWNNNVITPWMNNNYTSPTAWCVPPETTLLNGNGSTAEDTYINAASNTTAFGNSTTWGDLPHVITCLDYNASPNPVPLSDGAVPSAVANYQACLTALNSCPSSLPAACTASTLGRSLAGAAPAYNGCGSYKTWVQNSLALATNEAPKFALRAAFLTDIYNRAQIMHTIFPQGAAAIQQFLNTVNNLSSASVSTGGLPTWVIYGWTDPPTGGSTGQCSNATGQRVPCSHIVEVTASSPGRGGDSISKLPWVKTTTEGFLSTTRSYTLTNRDGEVTVDVWRWDEDHAPVLFPNGHTLWQSMFHSPGSSGGPITGDQMMQACNGLIIPSGNCASGSSCSVGFGLMPQTVTGLATANITPADLKTLSNSFMLSGTGTDSFGGSVNGGASYNQCLSLANTLLGQGMHTRACAWYVASSPAASTAPGFYSNGVNNKASADFDQDYSMQFTSCT